MKSLTLADKALIQKCGGVLSDEGREIRFDKILSGKPNRTCKKRLKELGYEISNRSGGACCPYIEYIFKEKV